MVGLDVDGVIADFYLSTCDRYNVIPQTQYSWFVDVINDNLLEIIDDTSFWDGLKVLNHPDKLTFDFDYYVTSIPPKQLKSRIEWLDKHGFPKKPVIVSEDKLTTCKELGITILIDDKPDTLKQFKDDSDVIGIQYHSDIFEYGIHGDYFVKCLTEVNDIISQIKKK